MNTTVVPTLFSSEEQTILLTVTILHLTAILLASILYLAYRHLYSSSASQLTVAKQASLDEETETEEQQSITSASINYAPESELSSPDSSLSLSCETESIESLSNTLFTVDDINSILFSDLNTIIDATLNDEFWSFDSMGMSIWNDLSEQASLVTIDGNAFDDVLMDTYKFIDACHEAIADFSDVYGFIDVCDKSIADFSNAYAFLNACHESLIDYSDAHVFLEASEELLADYSDAHVFLNTLSVNYSDAYAFLKVSEELAIYELFCNTISSAFDSVPSPQNLLYIDDCSVDQLTILTPMDEHHDEFDSCHSLKSTAIPTEDDSSAVIEEYSSDATNNHFGLPTDDDSSAVIEEYLSNATSKHFGLPTEEDSIESTEATINSLNAFSDAYEFLNTCASLDESFDDDSAAERPFAGKVSLPASHSLKTPFSIVFPAINHASGPTEQNSSIFSHGCHSFDLLSNDPFSRISVTEAKSKSFGFLDDTCFHTSSMSNPYYSDMNSLTPYPSTIDYDFVNSYWLKSSVDVSQPLVRHRVKDEYRSWILKQSALEEPTDEQQEEEDQGYIETEDAEEQEQEEEQQVKGHSETEDAEEQGYDGNDTQSMSFEAIDDSQLLSTKAIDDIQSEQCKEPIHLLTAPASSTPTAHDTLQPKHDASHSIDASRFSTAEIASALLTALNKAFPNGLPPCLKNSHKGPVMAAAEVKTSFKTAPKQAHETKRMPAVVHSTMQSSSAEQELEASPMKTGNHYVAVMSSDGLVGLYKGDVSELFRNASSCFAVALYQVYQLWRIQQAMAHFLWNQKI